MGTHRPLVAPQITYSDYDQTYIQVRFLLIITNIITLATF